jgi:hypothetical protein
MKRPLFFLVLILGNLAVFSQNSLNLDHAGWYGGMAESEEIPKDMVVDSRGDYYVVGTIMGGCDFDAGPAYVPAGSTIAYPFYPESYLAKYNPQGELYWVKILPVKGEVNALGILPNGDLIMAGQSYGETDLDPGPGTFLSGNNAEDRAWILALSRHAEFHWAVDFPSNPGSEFQPLDLSVSPVGDIYLSGNLRGSGVDFDPGPGTTSLSAQGWGDAVIARYDSIGQFKWVRSMGGTGYDQGKYVHVTSLGDVVMGGEFSDTADFDPGPGQLLLTSAINNSDPNVFVLALDSLGGLLWVNHVATERRSYLDGLAFDTAGGCWLSGRMEGDVDFDRFNPPMLLSSDNYVQPYVAHYDAQGQLQQVAFVGGSGPILDDGHGGIYLSGSIWDTLDMDPSPAFVTVECHQGGGYQDGFVAHYSPQVTFDWAFGFGNWGEDHAVAMARGPYQSVVIAATYYGDVDLDPGAGSAFVHHRWALGHAIAAYNQHGSYLWSNSTVHVSKGGADEATHVLVDQQGNTTILGFFEGDMNADPGNADTLPQTTWYETATSIMQYDAQGQYNWGFRFGRGYEHPHVGFFLDPQDNLCFVSTTHPSIDIDPGSGVTLLTPTPSFTGEGVPMIVKYSSTGGLVWGKLVQTRGATLDAATMDQAGNFYLTGKLKDTVDFDPGPGQWNLASSFEENYLQKLDPNGNLLWAIKFEAQVQVNCVQASPTGGIYLAGIVDYGGDLDPSPGGTHNFIPSANAFLVRLDDQGTLQMAYQFPSLGSGERILFDELACDDQGRLLAVGRYVGSPDFEPGPGVQRLPFHPYLYMPFSARYDSLGQLSALSGLGESHHVTPNSIAYDPDGHILIGGRIEGITTFDSTLAGGTIDPGFFGGALVLVLDSSFEFLAGGSLNNPVWNSQVLSGTFAPDGSIVVCGETFSAIDMDPGTGTYTLPAYGQGDAFFGRYHLCTSTGLSYTEPQMEYCTTAPDFQLAPGTPAGGTYAGTGVSGNMFSPQTAGPGTHRVAYTYTDSAGCEQTAWATFVVSTCLSKPETQDKKPSFVLYPNPSTGRLALELSDWQGGPLDIQLYDMWGRQVHRARLLTPDQELELSALPAGMYHVVLSGKALQATKRWVKVD